LWRQHPERRILPGLLSGNPFWESPWRKKDFGAEKKKMIETEKQDKGRRFQALYESFIGNFPKGGLVQVWEDFLDKVTENDLESLVRAVAKEYLDKARKPLLPAFEKELQRIEAEKGALADRLFDDCEICDRGLMVFPACYVPVQNDAGETIRQDFFIGNPQAGRLFLFAIPCKCSQGQRYAHARKMRFTELYQTRAFNWLRSIANITPTREAYINNLIFESWKDGKSQKK